MPLNAVFDRPLSNPDSGLAILGGTFILMGTLTVVRRRNLSASRARWMRFWTGRDEERGLSEFDYAVSGGAAVAVGILLVLFAIFG